MDTTIESNIQTRNPILAYTDREKPNLEAAAKFISALSANGVVTFQTFDDSPTKDKRLSRILHGTLKEHADELTRLNEQGAGVFVMVNEGNLEGRENKNVTYVRSVEADFDGVTPPEQFPLEPSAKVESSPGKFHVYWFVSGFPLNNELFNQTQEAIAKAVGAKLHDCKGLARVMRLPGFYHQKNEPVMTRLLEVHSERVYGYAEILEAFPLPVPPKEDKVTTRDNTGDTDKPSPRKIIEHMLGSFSVDEGRNNFGFGVAMQIRDNGYSKDECTDAMLQHYLPAVEDLVDPPYTENEMLASIEQVYKREPRQSWTRQATKTYPLTDAGNAERLVDEYGGKFCYAKGLGWLAYDGTRWAQDDSAVMRYALQTIRGLNLTAAASYEKLSTESDANQREALQKQIDALRRHIKTCEGESRLRSMVSLARHIEGVTVDLDMFDRQDDLLNCPSGTVNLKTGVLREHRPEDLLTQITDVEYNPAATCPKWEIFQSDICKVGGKPDVELVGYKQQLWGYTLTGETSEQKMMVAYGNGSNGKSTELEVVRHILGEYAKTTAFTTFLERKEGSATNDIAALRGARFVYASEGDVGAKLSESLVKTITGDGTLSARYLYKEHFTFRPHCKIWLATNHLPTISGQNNGIWRRLLPLDYAARFEGVAKVKNMDAVLKAEAVGILAWMVRGAMVWYQQGLEPLPQRVRHNHSEYKNSQDVVGEFIEDSFDIKADETLDKADFQEAFNDWGKLYNYKLSAKSLTQVMTEKGYKLRKSGGRRYYTGLKPKEKSYKSEAVPFEDWN